MGNEGSILPGLELDPIPLENTDEWSLHAATTSCTSTPHVSVFSELQVSSHSTNSFLEQAIKNLRIYRHPNILKYLSSWSQQGKLCMATESVCPLTRVLGSQTPLQICVGLHDILKALVFLHDKAQSSHNNVCCAAVYVTSDGSWKLGGLEFLCRFSEINSDFLQKTRSRRYEKAVPPEEDAGKVVDPEALDSFAFGILVEEVLKKISIDAQVPGMSEFREVCRKQLQNSEPTLRPKLSQLLDQAIFNHKFVLVHDFLSELPVKSDSDKTTFFRNLTEQLREFPESLVASQLGTLLLSRMVLLDKTAQEHLLPFVLQPRLESKSESNSPLFSMNSYQQFIVPRLLHILSVRDAQVRLLLLNHFQHFCSAFSKEQLQNKVLPELLVGIKDTNDTVVANTLRALACLVPVLGAATVIGGKRAKLFTDGRPKSKQFNSFVSGAQSKQRSKGRNEILGENADAELPERPSPDGGEDVTSIAQADEETDAWSDWDVNETQGSSFAEEMIEHSSKDTENMKDNSSDDPKLAKSNPCNPDVRTPTSVPTVSPQPGNIPSFKTPLPDIALLDIKNSPIQSGKRPSLVEELDFFQDMEPVISKPSILLLDDVELKSSGSIPIDPSVSSCFDIDLSATVNVAGEGWGDAGDWGDVSDSELVGN